MKLRIVIIAVLGLALALYLAMYIGLGAVFSASGLFLALQRFGHRIAAKVATGDLHRHATSAGRRQLTTIGLRSGTLQLTLEIAQR